MVLSRTTALVVAIGFLSITTLAFMISVIVLATSQKSEDVVVPTPSPPHRVSNASGWIEAAKIIRLSIDESVDPCQDFYKFACGSWIALHPIPESKARYDSFSVVRDRVREMTNTLLSTLNPTIPTEGNDTATMTALKNAYTSCMNETRIEAVGAKPLIDVIDKELGGWPLLQTGWSAATYDVAQTVAFLTKKYVLQTIVSGTIFADRKNTTRNIFYLDQATLSFGTKSEDFYLKNDTNTVAVRQAYIALMQNVTSMLTADGLSHNSSPQVTDFEAILNFEIQLAAINVPANKRRNETAMYNPKTIGGLDKLAPSFNWSRYFGEFNQSALTNKNETVVVVEPTYLARLNDLLKNTDKKTIANYLVWRLIYDRLTSLNRKYMQAVYGFHNKLRGSSMPSRTDFCLSFLIGEPDDGLQYFGYGVGRVFVDAHFTAVAKERVATMADKLLEAFKDMVSQLSWMDQTTKDIALKKAENMWKNVGYPAFMRTPGELDQYYAALNEAMQNEEVFYMTNQRILQWMFDLQLKDLTKPFIRTSFGGSPAVVNAWYSNVKNSITFPAGILQSPFFDSSFPMAVNFGAIGSVIGHEITHGFDDQGAQHDVNGNLQNWWSASSAKNFRQKTHCMVEQYSKYCFAPDLCTKGENTLGENIADNGGIRESFRAYQAYQKANGTELRLPTLSHYSMDQIFFISFASFWCGSFKEAFLRNVIATNEHAPNEFRVKGVIQNSEEFAKAFHCPLGSPMNPEHKCTVW